MSAVSAGQAVAHLYIHLRMRIVVHVSVWSIDPAVGAVRVVISKNVSVIVREAKPRRERSLVIRRIKVPVVRRLSQQCRVIRASRLARVRINWEFRA